MNQETTTQEQITAPEKVKKLKLKPFQMVMNNHIDVVLKEYNVPCEGCEEIETFYGAVLLLWTSTTKAEDFPILMHLPVSGPCYTQVAMEALDIAGTMCESVGDTVTVLDEDGEESFVVSVDEIVESYEECPTCSEGV